MLKKNLLKKDKILKNQKLRKVFKMVTKKVLSSKKRKAKEVTKTFFQT